MRGFGVWLRCTGQRAATSDVDVLVVGSSPFASGVEALGVAAERLRRDVNPVVMTKAELSAKLAAGDRFVSRIAREPKILRDDGVGDGDSAQKPSTEVRERLGVGPRLTPHGALGSRSTLVAATRRDCSDNDNRTALCPRIFSSS
jgi:hypothetical protein